MQQKIVHNGKCVLNPGSVGLPLHSGGKTQFLILHGNNGVWPDIPEKYWAQAVYEILGLQKNLL